MLYPGGGDYTAGAIASFAFDLPYPAVDGNQCTARDQPATGKRTPHRDTLCGKRLCTQAVEELRATQLPPSQLGQALIELGALVCTPQSPQCSACPASSWCRVAGLPLARLLPIKGGGKLTLRDRYFSYIYSTYHQQVLQEKRGRNDIWRGLYQFPLFESDSPQTPEAVAHWVEDELSYSGGAPCAYNFQP